MLQNDTVEEKISKAFNILEGKQQIEVTNCNVSRSQLAATLFEEALSTNPFSYKALLGLAECYAYEPYLYPKAISLLQQAIELNPNKPEAYYQMGIIFLNAEDENPYLPNINVYEEALKYFSKALALGYTQKANIYDLLATTYFRMKKFQEAINLLTVAFENAKKENANIPSICFLSAEANEAIGNFEEALNWYNKYQEHGNKTDKKEIDIRIKKLRKKIQAQSENQK